jgi:Immunoglobulin I-set domain.
MFNKIKDPFSLLRYKNGEVLEESERNVITNEGKSYKLEIVRTTHSDAGEYSVVVKNRLGEASSKGSLEIAGENMKKPMASSKRLF